MSIQVINQEWLDSNINPKAGDSLWNLYGDYLASPVGKFRNLALIQKSLDFSQYLKEAMGWSRSIKVTNLTKNLSLGISSLGLLSLPKTTADAIESVTVLHQNDGVDWGRKSIKAIQNLSNLASSAIYSYGFVTTNKIPLGSAKAFDLTSDFADLHLTISDYQKTGELEKAATGQVKEAITHSKKYYLLGVIKDVISISACTFGFGLLAFVPSVVAVTALLAASLIALIFSIYRDLYKQGGKYPIIELDRVVQLV